MKSIPLSPEVEARFDKQFPLPITTNDELKEFLAEEIENAKISTRKELVFNRTKLEGALIREIHKEYSRLFCGEHLILLPDGDLWKWFESRLKGILRK